MNAMDAGDHLAAAERARQRVRHNSRWPRWLYIGYAIAGFIYITVCGLPVPKGVFWAAFAVWIGAAVGLTVFAVRQRVEPRGHARRFTTVVAVSLIAWMTVFIVGTLFFAHNPAWWIPGAVVYAAIMLAGAWSDARKARR